VTTYQEADALNVFAPGNSAFLRNWPYAWSVTQDEAADSPLVGKVGVQPLPMGDGEGASNAATLGGWQMMVSKYSPNQEAGIEFVKFMCSPELQLSYAVERSHLPTIGSVYDDPQVAEASEFIPRLRAVFEGGAVARPSSVSADLYNSVSIAYFSQLHSVLTGQQDGTTAVAAMETELTDIMADV
jgi:trehalose/maltose transport system substrate-binding protein